MCKERQQSTRQCITSVFMFLNSRQKVLSKAVDHQHVRLLLLLKKRSVGIPLENLICFPYSPSALHVLGISIFMPMEECVSVLRGHTFLIRRAAQSNSSHNVAAEKQDKYVSQYRFIFQTRMT